MTKTYRRVVTGEDADGKAVFVSDEPVGATALSNWPPETGVWKLWGANQASTLPANGAQFDYDTVFPPSDGFRFEILSLWPESAQLPALSPEQLAAEIEAKLPGLVGGSHVTDTVDLVIILDGEIWLGLDDGEERLLQQGDTVIQNGTRHEWHNRSARVCTMAVVLLGATRA